MLETCHRGAKTWTKTNSEKGKDGKRGRGNREGRDTESELEKGKLGSWGSGAERLEGQGMG